MKDKLNSKSYRKIVASEKTVKKRNGKNTINSVDKNLKPRKFKTSRNVSIVQVDITDTAERVQKILKKRKIEKIRIIENTNSVREITGDMSSLNVIEVLKPISNKQAKTREVYKIVESPSRITIEMKSLPTIPRPKEEETEKE